MDRMIITTASNMHDSALLTVSADCYQGRPAVSLTSTDGSLHLQHDMTPDQARAMAHAMITAANLADIGAANLAKLAAANDNPAA